MGCGWDCPSSLPTLSGPVCVSWMEKTDCFWRDEPTPLTTSDPHRHRPLLTKPQFPCNRFPPQMLRYDHTRGLLCVQQL